MAGLNYRTIPLYVEAFQWDGNPVEGFEIWNPGTGKQYLECNNAFNTDYAKKGDWVVTHENGSSYRYSQEDFNRQFERVFTKEERITMYDE